VIRGRSVAAAGRAAKGDAADSAAGSVTTNTRRAQQISKKEPVDLWTSATGIGSAPAAILRRRDRLGNVDVFGQELPVANRSSSARKRPFSTEKRIALPITARPFLESRVEGTRNAVPVNDRGNICPITPVSFGRES
jgi:hypothetical protein